MRISTWPGWVGCDKDAQLRDESYKWSVRICEAWKQINTNEQLNATNGNKCKHMQAHANTNK